MNYWLLQGIGWGLYTLATFMVITTRLSDHSAAMVNAVLISVIGLLTSHGMRYVVKRTDWAVLSMTKALGCYFLLLCLFTALWEVSVIVLSALFLPGFELSQVSPWAVLYYFGTYFIVLMTWLLLYRSYHIHLTDRQRQIETLKLQVALQEAQLQGLKFQMNPHFLFNALNSIRSLALVSVDDTREMVSRLAMMLRYTLSSGEKAFVTLAEEIEVVKHYLAIEQVRFEQRLQVKWQIEPNTLDCAVLPMSVQTLVENAVKHGIASLPQGGLILIKTSLSDGLMSIEIENPGQLPTQINENVGLTNTRERLALKFGNDADLQLSQDNDKVIARLILPITGLTDETDRPNR